MKIIIEFFILLIVVSCSSKQIIKPATRPLPISVCKPKIVDSSSAETLQTRESKPLVRVPPQYPREAYDNNQEGWVKLSFIIAINGETKNIVISDSSPKGVFDQVAIHAIEQWKFSPKQVNCQDIESDSTQILQFKMSK